MIAEKTIFSEEYQNDDNQKYPGNCRGSLFRGNIVWLRWHGDKLDHEYYQGRKLIIHHDDKQHDFNYCASKYLGNRKD